MYKWCPGEESAWPKGSSPRSKSNFLGPFQWSSVRVPGEAPHHDDRRDPVGLARPETVLTILPEGMGLTGADSFADHGDLELAR